jgi:hypothetical protein
MGHRLAITGDQERKPEAPCGLYILQYTCITDNGTWSQNGLIPSQALLPGDAGQVNVSPQFAVLFFFPA